MLCRICVRRVQLASRTWGGCAAAVGTVPSVPKVSYGSLCATKKERGYSTVRNFYLPLQTHLARTNNFVQRAPHRKQSQTENAAVQLAASVPARAHTHTETNTDALASRLLVHKAHNKTTKLIFCFTFPPLRRDAVHPRRAIPSSFFEPSP